MKLEFPATHAQSSKAPGPFGAFGTYRSLTLELAKRDVLGRYRGASFGLLWSLISPFLMLMVYSFAFGFVMKSKWPQTAQGHVHYSIILFVGLIVHGFFAECLNRDARNGDDMPFAAFDRRRFGDGRCGCEFHHGPTLLALPLLLL